MESRIRSQIQGIKPFAYYSRWGREWQVKYDDCFLWKMHKKGIGERNEKALAKRKQIR
jgi:hypothetical protein